MINKDKEKDEEFLAVLRRGSTMLKGTYVLPINLELKVILTDK